MVLYYLIANIMLLFLLLFLITTAWSAQDMSGLKVGRIPIEGVKTYPSVILRLIDTRPGQAFNSITWNNDIQRIKNTDFFYAIEGGVAKEGDGAVPFLKLKNKHSTIPIFKYKQGGGTSLVTAGLYEINFARQLLETGAQWERMNGKDGAALWFRHPYPISHLNHFGAEIYWHAINLPLLTKKGEPEAYFTNQEKRFNARWRRELAPQIKTGIELSFYRNEFTAENATADQTARNAQFLGSTQLRAGKTISWTPLLLLGNINRERHHIEGQEIFFKTEIALKTSGSDFEFVKAQTGWTGGLILREKWNLAWQARLGTKSGHEFQHKFYLGGLDTVRGFLDGQFRGEHMWLANLELRPTFFEGPRWVLQGNLFADLSKTWDAKNFGSEGFHHPFLSLGAGCRVILPWVYRAVIRLDAARTLEPIRQTGFNFGLQQFF